MSRFHTILAAVDFSQTSEDAVATAVEICKANHARLHLLHVVPNVQVPYAIEPVVFDFTDVLRQHVEAAHQQLAALASRQAIDPAVVTPAVVNGPPASEIVDYAREHAIDLIVLGAHGHGFLDRLLIGSVAERVARRAPCAVLLVPHVARRLTSFEAKAAAGVES
jgi:nucleotide-binding universal stress UspA family protein